MSIEATPLDNSCNLSCGYCYQDPMRAAGNTKGARYDLGRMKATIERLNPQVGHGFTTFGGEPLLVPLADLEDLWRWGFEKWGKNSVQTNGVLITDAHIALFKRYRVHVGFSVDGPDDLNDSRWAGDVASTREASAKSLSALYRLIADPQIEVSLIATLYRGNATGDSLLRFMNWLFDLDNMGLQHARIHALEIENASVAVSMGMTDAEQITALLAVHEAEQHMATLRFDVFNDIRHLLKGDMHELTCVWNACDPYTTSAVQGVDGQGNLANCGRTNKDGIRWLKADTRGIERYLALAQTPQEHGGCKDCRFFYACKGECPGTAIDNDWRNRTSQCAVWMALFEHVEAEMVAAGQSPVSLDKERREKLTTYVLTGQSEHGDAPHGDAPHGDAPHGDHADVPQGEAVANGFRSVADMEDRHALVLSRLSEIDQPNRVLDFGCGTGALLAKIPARAATTYDPATTARVGVEIDVTRIAMRDQIEHGDGPRCVHIVPTSIVAALGTLVGPFDVALISERRIEEMTAGDEINHFMLWCRENVHRLLVYSYDEPHVYAEWRGL